MYAVIVSYRKYGHSIEEVGFKRIPQKEVITIYRLRQKK